MPVTDERVTLLTDNSSLDDELQSPTLLNDAGKAASPGVSVWSGWSCYQRSEVFHVVQQTLGATVTCE